VISISINGTARQLADSTSVAALVEEMGLAGKRIALERNGVGGG
jgi:thiamine biosynthesis protein ThiS